MDATIRREDERYDTIHSPSSYFVMFRDLWICYPTMKYLILILFTNPWKVEWKRMGYSRITVNRTSERRANE